MVPAWGWAVRVTFERRGPLGKPCGEGPGGGGEYSLPDVGERTTAEASASHEDAAARGTADAVVRRWRSGRGRHIYSFALHRKFFYI
jgi:hypothetical protein